MGEGELYRRMKISLAELPFDEHYEKGAKRHLDEAKKDFPTEEMVDEEYGNPLCGDDVISFEETREGVRKELIYEWFHKWFGDSS